MTFALELDRRNGTADKSLLDEARNLHSEMLADLRSWTHARGPLVGLAREDLSPIAAAFLASLRELSGQHAEPLTPVLTCSTDGQSQFIADCLMRLPNRQSTKSCAFGRISVGGSRFSQ